MDNFEHFRELYNFIKDFELKYNSESETITIISDAIISPDSILSDYTKINEGLEFSVNIFDFVLFIDENEFSEKWKKAIDSKKDIAIINKSNSPKYYSIKDKKSYNDFIENENYYFKNIFTYHNFINFFINKSNTNYNEFQFVDSFDINTRKLFFTSSNEPGKLVLGYPSELPDFEDTSDYSLVLKRLENSFDPINKYLPIFIKNEIFKYFNNKNEFNGFVKLFNNLETILDLADKNYQIYLHELSLDKIKTDYKEYKQKYFASQNEILSKIAAQVIALPVSIAASTYSLFSLEGNWFPTLIVCFGILGYIIYINLVIRIFSSDIIELNIQSGRDYDFLKNHDFFKKNSEELTYFKNIKENLFNRLYLLMISLKLFTFIVWASSFSLLFYGLKIWNRLAQPQLIVMVLLFLFTFIFNDFLFKKQLRKDAN